MPIFRWTKEQPTKAPKPAVSRPITRTQPLPPTYRPYPATEVPVFTPGGFSRGFVDPLPYEHPCGTPSRDYCAPDLGPLVQEVVQDFASAAQSLGQDLSSVL